MTAPQSAIVAALRPFLGHTNQASAQGSDRDITNKRSQTGVSSERPESMTSSDTGITAAPNVVST